MDTSIHHYGVNVSDINRSIDFYTGILDVDEVHRYDAGSVLSELQGIDDIDGEIAKLERADGIIELIEYRPLADTNVNDDAPGHATGRCHLCIRVDDVDAWYEQLTDEIEPASDIIDSPSGARLVYLQDPDGHLIELTQNPGITR